MQWYLGEKHAHIVYEKEGPHWAWRTVGGKRVEHEGRAVVVGAVPNPRYWLASVTNGTMANA